MYNLHKKKAHTAKARGGPLHHTQLGPNITFKYIMLDMTAPHHIFNEDGTNEPLYGLVSTCMMSKLTHITAMEGKDVSEFLLAINVLIGEVGVPEKLYVDQEKGLLKLMRNMLVEVNEQLLRDHQIAVEEVSPGDHFPHGLVERRAKVIGNALGLLSHKKETITKVQFSNMMRIMAARMNATSYGIYFLNTETGPNTPDQKLNLEAITTGGFMDDGFVHIPGSLELHQESVADQLELLRKFYSTDILPRLALDVDRKRTVSAPEL